MTHRADILYVDDAPEELLVTARSAAVEERFAHFEPNEAKATRAAARANLWVFDFFNDDNQRTNPSLQGVNTNGLSVFHQFRLLVGDSRPPAVLVSNHLEDAIGVAVLPAQRHLLAEQVGVEWIAAKSGRGYDPISEIISIADGTARLQSLGNRLAESTPSNYASDFSALVLKLPKRSRWAAAAIRSVAEWRPPVWVLPQATASARSHGSRRHVRMARDVMAWMLRHALPYPSFVVRERYLALRLRITLGCLRDALREDTRLAALLDGVAYEGILSDFDGPRWWTAGVDAIDWQLPRDRTERTAELARLTHPVPLSEITVSDPVIVSDADLIETDEIADISECVRATDDHFPAHAAPAWVKIVAAREDRTLARKVRLEDQGDLETGELES